jgi:hypothetical protein
VLTRYYGVLSRSDVTSDMELEDENPQEGCIVTRRTLTSKRMRLAFSHIEEQLDILTVCDCMHL